MDGITQLDVRQMHTNLTHAQNEPDRHPSTRVTTGAFAPASDWATRSGIFCASSERSLEHNSLFEGAVPECPAVYRRDGVNVFRLAYDPLITKIAHHGATPLTDLDAQSAKPSTV